MTTKKRIEVPFFIKQLVFRFLIIWLILLFIIAGGALWSLFTEGVTLERTFYFIILALIPLPIIKWGLPWCVPIGKISKQKVNK